jgi:hypothetical protein
VPRRVRLLLIALGVIVFLALSGLLARALSVDGAERAAITQLVREEARGNPRAMAALILGCPHDPACRARVQQDAATLKRPGHVSILEINPSAGFSLSSTLGTARVAWKTGTSRSIVQCVRVRRAGNVISGLSIQLLAISRRIDSGSICPVVT